MPFSPFYDPYFFVCTIDFWNQTYNFVISLICSRIALFEKICSDNTAHIFIPFKSPYCFSEQYPFLYKRSKSTSLCNTLVWKRYHGTNVRHSKSCFTLIILPPMIVFFFIIHIVARDNCKGNYADKKTYDKAKSKHNKRLLFRLILVRKWSDELHRLQTLLAPHVVTLASGVPQK